VIGDEGIAEVNPMPGEFVDAKPKGQEDAKGTALD
jgi:hypothetical protein